MTVNSISTPKNPINSAHQTLKNESINSINPKPTKDPNSTKTTDIRANPTKVPNPTVVKTANTVKKMTLKSS
jgi:hypothetical protein